MTGTAAASSDVGADSRSPSLAALRLVGSGHSVAVLSPDAGVQWWCAPEFDDQPLCWRLLDPSGGTAHPRLEYVDATDAPAGASTSTLLRDTTGLVEVRDGLLPRSGGVLLVRLVRRRPDPSGPQRGAVEHELRGCAAPWRQPIPVRSTAHGRAADRSGRCARRRRPLPVRRAEDRAGTELARARRWPGLDADRVDASGEAYAFLRTPDATLGIASAGVSLVLADTGSAQRHEEQPWIPLALLAKSLFDAAGGAYLFAEQVTKHKKVCSSCTVSAGLLLATVPAVLPEARCAWHAWRRG